MQEFHQFLAKPTRDQIQTGSQSSTAALLETYRSGRGATLNDSKVPLEHFGQNSTPFVAVSGLFSSAPVSSVLTTTASCRRSELSAGDSLQLLKGSDQQGFPIDYFSSAGPHNDYDSTAVYAVLRSQPADSGAASAAERLLRQNLQSVGGGRNDRLHPLSTVRPTISPALLCAIQQVTEEERLKTDQQRLTVSHNQQSQSNLPPLPQLDSLVSSIGLTSNSPVVTPLETHVDLSGNRLGRSGRQSPVSSYDDSPTLEDIGGANEDSSDDLYGRVIKDYANGANEILKPGVNGRKRRRSSSSNSGFGDGTTPLGRQQHSCETCGKSFQNNSALIKHKLIHSDERKFVCLQCSKGFKRLDHLNGHLNVHKSVKPFQCVITGCDKSYCDARSLRRHLEHAHNMHNPVVHSSRGIINVRCEGVNYSRAMNSTSHVGESSSRRPTSQLSSNSAESGGNSVRSHNNSSSAAVASGELESGAENSESDSSPPDHWKKKSQKDCVKPKSLPTAQPVTCGQCNRVFKNVPALNGHMRLHSQQGKKGHPGKPESNANGSSPQFSSPTGSCASASDSRVLSPPGPNCPTSGMGTFCPAIATEQQNQQQHDQMDYGNYVGSAPNAEPPNIMNPLPITRVVGHYADFHPTPLENDLINSFTECYSPAPVAQHHLSAPEPLTIEPLDHNNVMAAGQDPMIHSAPASFYYNESSNYSADPDHFTLGGFIDKPRYSMTDGHCVVQQDQQQNSVGLQQTLYVETYQDQSDSKCQMSDQMQNHQDPMNNSHFSHPSNNMAIVPFDTGMNPFAYGIVANGGQNHIDPVIHPANRNLLMSVEPVNEGILSTQMVHGGTDVHSNCMAMSHGHVNGGGQQLLSGMNLLGQHQQTHMGIGDSMSNMDHYANTGGMMNQPNQFGQVGGNIFTDLDESMMNATSDLGSSEYNQANSMSEFDDDLNDRELASLFQISLNYGMFETPQSCAPGTSSQYYQYGSSYAEQNAEKGESLRKRHFTAPGAISMSKFHTTGKPLKPLSPKTKKRHKCLPGSSLFHQQAGGNGVGGGAQQSRTSACTRDVRRSQQQYVEKKFFNLPVSPVRFKKRSNRPTPLLLPGAATLNRFCSQLRSPKCWEYPQSGSKIPPYTPPPILSPMRLGSGLFWKLGRLAHCYLVGPRSAPIAQKFSNPFNSSSPITQASRKENSLLPPGDQELLEVLTDPTAENDGLIETSSRPHINVGEEFQAVIPEYSDRSYYPSDYDAGDLCVFKPETLQQSSEDSIRNFLDFGCTAGVYGGGRNLELALNLLHFCNGEVQEAVSQLIHLHANQDAQQLVPYGYVDTEIWTQEEIVRFSESLQKFDKDFYAVAHEIPTKTVKMCVSFYYFWKKVCQDEYKRLRTLRRKREMADHMGVYNLRSSNSAVTIVTEELPEEPTAQLSRMHLSNSGSGRDYSTDNAGTGDRGMGGVEKSRVTFNEVLQSDFPCKVCGKVFEKTKSRNAHMRSHSAKGVQ